MTSDNPTLSLREVHIPAGPVHLSGDLTLPSQPEGLVIFAHGSGSSRLSPRNQFVAGALQRGGLGTLLLDLLTPEEEAIDEATGRLRFDIELLGSRLADVTHWVHRQPDLQDLPVGYFGASTGAAAALKAAAHRPDLIAAVVSRGGRPDLAMNDLPKVKAPTLLIVGARDAAVIEMNREAMKYLSGTRELALIPGATHLFEEPFALDEVARLARQWFAQHLASPKQAQAIG